MINFLVQPPHLQLTGLTCSVLEQPNMPPGVRSCCEWNMLPIRWVPAAVGMSLFMASLGYQPLLFEFQKDEVVVPSVLANLKHCRSAWQQVLFLPPSLFSTVSEAGQSKRNSNRSLSARFSEDLRALTHRPFNIRAYPGSWTEEDPFICNSLVEEDRQA